MAYRRASSTQTTAGSVVLPRSSGAINATVFFQAVVRPRAKLVNVPSCFGDPDDRHIEMPALHHSLKRRKNLLVSQIASRAEEYQRVRLR